LGYGTEQDVQYAKKMERKTSPQSSTMRYYLLAICSADILPRPRSEQRRDKRHTTNFQSGQGTQNSCWGAQYPPRCSPCTNLWKFSRTVTSTPRPSRIVNKTLNLKQPHTKRFGINVFKPKGVFASERGAAGSTRTFAASWCRKQGLLACSNLRHC